MYNENSVIGFVSFQWGMVEKSEKLGYALLKK